MSQDGMSRVIKNLPLVACALALAGCANPFGQEGYFRDKSGDYTEARVTAPLVIPGDMNAEPMGDALAIPEISASHDNLGSDFAVPRPDQTLSRNIGEVFTIERQGNDQWLQVSLSPAETWPNVLTFLEESQLPVATQNVQQGYVETEWADLGKDDSSGFMVRTLGKLIGAEVTEPMQDRFLIEVKQGVQPGSAEVHIKHKGRTVSAGAVEVAEWDNLPERSQQMDEAVLNELMLYLTQHDKEKSVSYLAQDLNLGSLAVLETDGAGNPQLRLDQLSYARSWSAVDAALTKAGVDVTDKNRSAGIFYISVNPQGAVVKEESSGGWFSGWFGSDEDAKKAATKDALLMRVIELNNVVRVSVEKDINTTAPVDVSNKLLNLVKENL